MNNSNYDDRQTLKKYCNKPITIIGKYIGTMDSVTTRTKQSIIRYLFRDITVKGDKITLDHIWIPDNGLISKVDFYTPLVVDTYYEIKGLVQKYAKNEMIKVDDRYITVSKMSYKIESICSFEIAKKQGDQR
jgi:lysyl-tRNA synthetase class I